MTRKKALILYNEISDNAAVDELDVLEQVQIVAENFDKLGIEHSTLTFGLNMQKAKTEILQYNPDFVFNLVEGIDGKTDLIFLAPALLKSLGIPFTGGSLEATFLTTSKILAKEKMKECGIQTPTWHTNHFIPEKGKRYIVKPIWEEASLGLDEHCVFWWNETPKVEFSTHFIEEYIDGREFNISILAGPGKPTVLPHAEIQFSGYEGNKPKVMGYSAKWKAESFEFANTYRTFHVSPQDTLLLNKLTELTVACWEAFKLNGYARVDFRIDKEGNPYVLEVNVNPCISSNGGFMAACEEANIPQDEIFSRIIADIPKNLCFQKKILATI